MQVHEELMREAMQRLISSHYHKILYVDLTADTYAVIAVSDYEWAMKNQQDPSKKISDWFRWFSESSLCREEDRERFREFTDLEHLRSIFEKQDTQQLYISYQRKFDEKDTHYSQAMMELIPVKREDGHLCVFLFVRNVARDYENYRREIEEVEKCNAFRRSGGDGKRTLLVVEDNELNREILCELLADDYKTLEAENGQIGLQMLQEHYQDISLVLLDVQMPIMNGYEFLKAVRRDPLFSTIPIIVTTGSERADEEETCLKLGASDFVSKPYNPNVVRSRISSIIRLKESSATLSAVEYDELTDLYTRQAFYHHAEVLLKRNPDTRYDLLISDIEDFKLINERYGAEVGDKLLRLMGESLKKAAKQNVLVGRYGGDQFVILVANGSFDLSDAFLERNGRELETRLSVPHLTVKYGIYEDVDHDESIMVLCDRALRALDTVKHLYGKLCGKYDKALQEKALREHQIEMSMQTALDQEQFSIYYQPKHETSTGKLIGAEALVRWIHPQYGFMSPGEFIPLFEKNGFIIEVDHYIWDHTCKNIRRWLDQGLTVPPISVNGSKLDFEQSNYLERVTGSLEKYHVSPEYLHLEVTESLFSDRLDEMVELLQQCRDAGIKIELDDFGTGYSSLNTLAILPLDVVKLDMSFMKQLNDPRRVRVLSTSVKLAKSLKLKTITEGVETEDQRKLVQNLHVDAIQGYYFSKPLPEAEFEEYMKKAAEQQKEEA